MNKALTEAWHGQAVFSWGRASRAAACSPSRGSTSLGWAPAPGASCGGCTHGHGAVGNAVPEWPWARHTPSFSCFSSREGTSLMLRKNPRAWKLEVCPGDSGRHWQALSEVFSLSPSLPPSRESCLGREIPAEEAVPPPLLPFPSSPNNHILLKAGGGDANQCLQKGSAKAYIKKKKKNRLQ